MIRSFRKYPPILQKQILIRLAAGIAAYMILPIIWLCKGGLELMLPFICFGTVFLISAVQLYARCEEKGYVVIRGICTQVDRTGLRRRLKDIYVQEEQFTVRIVRPARKNREKRFSSLDALQLDVLELEQTEDTYVTYERVYRVKGIEVIVRDERIGEALQFILPNQRAVLLLSFFRDCCDMEIARLLKISHKTVAYRKKIAMNRLRMLLEGMKDA